MVPKGALFADTASSVCVMSLRPKLRLAGREKREEGAKTIPRRHKSRMRFTGRGEIIFAARAQRCQAKYPGSCAASSPPNQKRGGRWRRPDEAAGQGRRRARERQDPGIW